MKRWRFVALAAGWALPGLAAAWDWHGSAGVLSDKVVYGISQNGGRASAFLDLNLRSADGWLAGAGIATLGAGRGRAELTLNAGHGGPVGELGAWQVQMTAFAPLGPGPLRRPAFQQLGLGYGWNERLQLGLWVAPKQPGPAAGGGRGRGRVLVAEASWHQPLGRHLALDFGIGRVDYGPLAIAPYGYGSVGLGWSPGPWQLFVTRVFNDGAPPVAAGPRALVSVLVNF